jgi:hypothetical protein
MRNVFYYHDFLKFWTPIDWLDRQGEHSKNRANKKYFKEAKKYLEELYGLEFESVDCETFNKAYGYIAEAFLEYSKSYMSAHPNKKKKPPVPLEIVEPLYILVYAKFQAHSQCRKPFVTDAAAVL